MYPLPNHFPSLLLGCLDFLILHPSAYLQLTLTRYPYPQHLTALFIHGLICVQYDDNLLLTINNAIAGPSSTVSVPLLNYDSSIFVG